MSSNHSVLMFLVAGLLLAGSNFAENKTGVEHLTDKPVISAQAQMHFEKALSYLNGQGVQQSYYQAIDHLRESQQLQHPEASAKLLSLQNHLLNEPSLQVRYRRTLNIAKQGDVTAQYELGRMCEYGLGVGADMDRARYWYEKAAQQNHNGAQNRMAMFYTRAFLDASEKRGSQTNTVVLDVKQIVQSLTIAAENNQEEAQMTLADFYYQGKMVEQDFQQAFYWYKRAAEKGNSQAQLQTGLMLKNGQGTAQDYELALLWLEKSLAQGHEAARIHVVSVNEILDDIFLENFK